VAPREYTPDRGGLAEGDAEDLKDDLSVLRAIACTSQSGEREGMRGIVGEVESTLARESGPARVSESGAPGADESVELGLLERLR